ncbi:MAG: DUF4130 domain-containing protein, partial [Rhizobiales bacterium]|nr:DUF4130 domain-containing protein [Hyphomicrobiales bacterium]
MHRVCLVGRGDLSEWRDAARALAAAGLSPQQVDWRIGGAEDELFEAAPDLPKPDPAAAPLTVPAGFLSLAEAVACHTEPGRFHLLYRLLWRLQSDRRLLELTADKDVAWARLLAKNVHRDSHKMTAFVRFKEITGQAEGRR